MDGNHFDSVSRIFAQRRLSRRKAMTGVTASVAAGALATAGLSRAAAQDATPESSPVAPNNTHGPATLFLQAFQSGSVAPMDAENGTYTVTLERGLGQTIYFSDRPDRIVGATPTVDFLEVIGFEPENPPNAAMVIEREEGQTDIAVVELLNPSYDNSTHTATYDVKVLAAWERALELGFTEQPTDLAAFGTTLGSVHLFIDDCPDATMHCKDRATGAVVGEIPNEDHDGYCYSYFNVACLPCAPAWDYQGGGNSAYWYGQCAERFEECQDDACYLTNFCSKDAPLGNTLCRGME
jgi:hypothetical protein